MRVKTLVVAVVETIIKVVVLVLAIMLIFKGITKAYDFGYRVFADKPMSSGTGRTITIGISEESDVKDVAAMLKEKGLIEDETLFYVQELLSSYHGKIKPGIYDLSTSMKVSEMLEIMSSGEDAETSSDSYGSETEAPHEEALIEESESEEMSEESSEGAEE